MKNVLLFTTLVTVLFSCQETHFKEDVVMAGGIHVTSGTLNMGKSIYTESCMPCHGVKGDGAGVAAKGMRVPPRNFKLGIIKFGDVASGDLPHDASIEKSLRHGLNGTAMLPWDLKGQQMGAVIQYIKTFAPETWIGKDKTLGTQVVATKDPFGLAHRAAAIEKGKGVYHIVAQCQSCHQAYVTKSELNRLSMKISKESITDFDDDMYQSKPQDSEHGVMTLPPDFTWDSVRSASSVEELYLRIAVGVGGTGMPAWNDTITDEEIWAVSYYVRSLMDLKDTAERKAMMQRLAN